jgi:hypothetical protein
VSRSGLLRAAALLAAGAAPLLAGAANAAEVPQLGGGLPEVGADKVISDATQHANPLESAGAVNLGQIKAPVASDLPVPAVPAVPAERTESSPVAGLGALPGLPNPGGVADVSGLTRALPVGGLKAPGLSEGLSQLPTNGVVPNTNVLSGTLPTING